MVTLGDIGCWIDLALGNDPPPELVEFCGDYYQPYYFFLSLVAHHFDRSWGLSVELGVETGRGAMAMALNNYRAIGIDNAASLKVRELERQFDNFTFLHQPSLPVPERIEKLDRPITLLHIDTEHSYSQAKAEFEAYRQYLARPAVVCFDDLHAQEDSVLRYFYSLPYPKIQDDRLHPVDGYGVLLYV